MSQSCANCGGVEATAPKGLVRCSGCQSVSYCGTACQTAHWATVHSLQCQFLRQKGTGKSQGTGYGGDKGDQRQRAAGRKQAAKRESREWSEWRRELTAFCSGVDKQHKKKQKHSHDDDTDIPGTIVNTLKQVLRCQAPDWWWQEPQRSLYDSALRACQVLTEHYPKAWGDREDNESAISALEELAQTSQLLVKILKNGKKTDEKEDPSSAVAASPVNTMGNKDKDKDVTMPLRVIDLRQQARDAIFRVMELPDCSMMDSGGYYRQELRPLAFDLVGQPFDRPPHHFTVNAGYKSGGGLPIPSFAHLLRFNKQKTNKPPKPTAHSLWKELSTYPTALPIEYGSSIYVRAQEEQMDLLRVLMIGPDDTPYANGAFMFDVSLGKDYPHCPPRMQFLTTKSFLADEKRVRFNPNLYEDGKVCLSLLGTWSGPGWQPGESTLLQVLVSIQSLILGTAEPYFNEPGWEASQGTAHGKNQSDQYNRNIRQQTLRVAILPFLQNELNQKLNSEADPPGTNQNSKPYFAEFAGVLRKHFRLKQRTIQKQLFQWFQDDPSLQALYSEYWNVWEQLEHLNESTNSRKPAAVPTREHKRRKRDAPGVKENADGVIEIDDDDDDDDNDSGGVAFQETNTKTVEAGKISAAENRQKEPELSNHRKAAGTTGSDGTKERGKMEPSGAIEHTDGVIELDDDDDDGGAQLALAIHTSITDREYLQKKLAGGRCRSNATSKDGEEDEKDDGTPAAVDRKSNNEQPKGNGRDLLVHAAGATAKALEVVDLT